jgi:hypothetical protein
MAPNPIAETSRPLPPNFRFCISVSIVFVRPSHFIAVSLAAMQSSATMTGDLRENGLHAVKRAFTMLLRAHPAG